MGFFASVFFVCCVLFVGLLFGLKLYARFCPTSFVLNSEKQLSCVLVSSFLMGGLVLSSVSFLPFSDVAFGALAGLTVLCLELSSFAKKWKTVLGLSLCLGTALFLYQFNLQTVYVAFVSAVIWWGIWRLFIWFDRFPLISFLTSTSWAVALFAVGLVMHTLPLEVLIPVALIGACVAAVSYFKLSQKQPTLGRLSASFAGFVWAGVWGYILMMGSVVQVTTAFGYYLFEGIVLGIAYYFKRPLHASLNYLLARPDLAAKAVQIVFSHLLILSFLSAMTLHLKWVVTPVVVFALAIVLVDLYLRLNTLVHPQPTWKELLKNTKDSCKLFTQQVQKKQTTKKVVRSKPRKKKRKTKK